MKEKLVELIGPSKNLDYNAIQEVLKKTGAYIEGYVIWVAERYGSSFIHSKLSKPDITEAFINATKAEKTDFPQHIYNAGNIYMQLSNSDIEFDSIIDKLISMCMPEAVYYLFMTNGVKIEKLEKAARIYTLTFPSVLEQMPQEYKDVGDRLINHDST